MTEATGKASRAASQATRPMGEVLAGRVELLDPIGEGGAGVIWRARDLRTGEIVAAKVLRQADAGGLLRFVQESSTSIAHPHVLAPRTWVAEDGQVALLMELVAGGSLAALIGDFGPLPPRLVAELLRQACEGLGAIHSAGVVHRDITPANLLLRATGTARPHLLVSDFGVAGLIDGPRLTHTAYSVGTPGYAAPEQQAGADPNPAQDLFALGRVCQEMLTGLRPPTGEYAEGPVSPALPAGVPPVLRDLVRSLTEVDPALRPASAEDVRARLDHPDLSWDEAALGEVEVLDHLEEVDRGGARPEVTRGEQAVPPATERDGGPGQLRGPDQRSRTPLVLALIVLMLLSAAVLIWALTQLF